MNFWREINEIRDDDQRIDDPIIENYSEKSIEGDSINNSSDRFLFSKNNINKRKIDAIFFIISAIFLLIIIRLIDMQIIESNYYANLSDDNKIRSIEIKPQRGIIIDKNLNPLVKNIPIFYIYYTPYDIPRDENSLNNIKESLGQILEIKNEDLDFIKFEKSYKKTFVSETDDINKITKLKIKNIPSIIIEPYFRREYVEVNSISHVLGYVGRLNDEDLKNYPNYKFNDNIGKSGVESFYEDNLRGISGERKIEVNYIEKENKILSEEEPQPGNNLKLTIDLNLQNKIEEIFKRNLESKQLKKATLIATDPKTGNVLAYANFPSYKLNDFSERNSVKINEYLNDSNNPLFNRVINGKYAPASTFKMLIGAIALEDGVITKDTIVNDLGSIEISHKYGDDIKYLFRGWKVSGLGKVNIYSAIAKSSDIFFYYVGGGFKGFVGLGVDKINNYLERLKINTTTGIDLPNESQSFFPDPEWMKSKIGDPWTLGNTYHISIGQGDMMITPIEINAYTNFFANRGIIYKPKVLDSILDKNNNQIYKKPDEILFDDKVISDKNIEIIRDSLREVVTKGTAKILNNSYNIAGKTGTAEVGIDGDLNSIFTGFAPFDDPKITLTIIVENGGEGSETAVPIAKEVFDAFFKSQKK